MMLPVLSKSNTSKLIEGKKTSLDHRFQQQTDLLNVKLRWMQTKPEAGRLAAALLINRRVHVIYFSLITAVNPAPADRPLH